MKRRKKYSPKRHCEQLMHGARFIYDGNEEHQVVSVDRYGRDLSRMETDALNGRPWRWHLSLTVVGVSGDLQRRVEREFVPEGFHRLNELGQLVDDTRTEVGLDMPPSFRVGWIEWTAKVL